MRKIARLANASYASLDVPRSTACAPVVSLCHHVGCVHCADTMRSFIALLSATTKSDRRLEKNTN